MKKFRFVILLFLIVVIVFAIDSAVKSFPIYVRFLLIFSPLLLFFLAFHQKLLALLLPIPDVQLPPKVQFCESKTIDDTQKLKVVSREMKKHIYDLHNLFEVSINITSILDYEQLINSFLLSLIGQMKTKGAIVFFPSNENWQILRPMFSKGISKKKISKLELSYNDSIIQYFEQRAVPVNLRNFRHENLQSDFWRTFLDAGLPLLAPIVEKRKVVGVIAVGNKMDDVPFTQSEIEIFSLMTNIASVAISNAKLYHQMEQISVTDELTGLYNYRFFKNQLIHEISRARRFQHALSLVIFDVDFFKNYNDALGHPAGDEALREIGRLFKNTARQSDIVSRYGGEEFCAILPEVDVKGAWYFSERLRKAIEYHTFFKEEVQPLGKLTISIGAASFPIDAMEMEQLLQYADQALYHAKHGGRNQVCLFSKAKHIEKLQ